MYCSSCGAAVARGLSYCNLCGAKLNTAKGESGSKPAEQFAEMLVGSIVGTFVLGLGVIIGLMAVMKDLLNFNQGLIITFTSLCFLLMVAIEGVLIGLLLDRRRGAKVMGETPPPKDQTTRELDRAEARSLPEPVPSVTEQTTRSFEPIYSEQPRK